MSDLGALPRVVWILGAGTLVNRFGSFVVPFLMLWLTSRGVPATDAGFAIGAWGVGHVGAALAGGWLADTLGRSRAIALSMGAGAATMLVLSQMTSVAAIAAVVLIFGFTSELYRPAASALIADEVPAERRVLAFAVYRLAINLGYACGLAVGGLLAERSFQWLFYADAGTSLAFGALALFALPASGARGAPRDEASREPFFAAALARPAFVSFLVGSALFASVLMQSSTTLALHVTACGMTTADFGLLLSFNGALVFLLEIPLSSITQRFPARRVIALGFVLAGLGFGATGLATSFAGIAATIVVWTIAEIAIAPVGSAYVAELAPPSMRGRFMGAWGLTWSLGLTVGPTAGAWLFTKSPPALWIASVALGIAAATLMLAVQQPPTRRA